MDFFYECWFYRLHDMLENVKIVTTRPGLPYSFSAENHQVDTLSAITVIV